MVTASERIVEARQLSHRYGIDWAIKDIDFSISRRGVVGLLGSNGAGKSTTMNIICGVLNQTDGQVLIQGIDMRAHPEESKKLIGFLPQNPPLHLDFTVDEYLIHCAHLRAVAKREIPEAVRTVKERCGIAHFSRRLIGNLSGGYRQRVGIAQAIIHRPRLVILDEPTNGLDPNQIVEVRRLVSEIAQDRAVLLSSHILSDIEATCQDIMMIENGRLVFSGTMETFNNHLNPNTLRVTLDAPPAAETLRAIPGITEVHVLDGRTVRLTLNDTSGMAERIVERSVAEGWRLQEIQLEKPSLESIFSHLSRRAAETPR